MDPLMLPRWLSQSVIAAIAAALAAHAPPAYAQSPDELLQRAIADRPATASASGDAAPAGEIADLVRRADELAGRQQWDQVIPLLEKAYRLDPADQNVYARLLMARRAAGRLSDADREALALIEEGREIQVDETIRVARLCIAQARDALKRGDADLAAAKVKAARESFAELPEDVDIAPYQRELDRLDRGLRRRAALSTKQPPAMNAVAADAQGSDDQPAHLPNGDDAAADSMYRPYQPDGRIVVPDGLSDDPSTDPSYRYQRQIARAAAASRARALLNVEDDLVFDDADGMQYPPDWPEKSQRRRKWRDGEIYRGPTHQTADGQEYYTAIYDLGDLVHPVPNFAAIDLDPRVRHQAILDRDAIRRNSLMFRGYAADLAAGIPVLQFYGGMDNWAVSPRYDNVEMERVLATIDAFMQGR